MSMSMSMAHQLVAIAGEQAHEPPDPMTLVRTDPGWIDHLYLIEFIQQSENVFTENNQDFEITYRNKVQTGVFDDEIRELLWKQEHPERYERMDDIIAESIDYTPRFMNSCGIDPHVHSQTVRLIETMSLIAYVAVIHYKNMFKQPRPSQLSEFISPAIQVPAHYSYPSGHATQAHLIALALTHVFGGTAFGNRISSRLDYDARSISENREWAGVHYSSDSEAGENLGKIIWKEIAEGDRMPQLSKLIDRAIEEWPSSNVVPEDGKLTDEK